MKKFVFILFILNLTFIVGACSSNIADPSQLYKGQTEAKIFQNGRNSMLKGNYKEAIKHFQALEAQYPFGPYTKYAQLNSIYTYYKQNDTASAISECNRYIHLHPANSNVDYAYYMRGLIELDENHGTIENYFGVDFSERDLIGLKGAYKDFSLLLHFFPHSKYANAAIQHLKYIRNTLAKHNLAIAKFYLRKKAYVAAANRASYIIKHYKNTDSAPEALKIIRKVNDEI